MIISCSFSINSLNVSFHYLSSKMNAEYTERLVIVFEIPTFMACNAS